MTHGSWSYNDATSGGRQGRRVTMKERDHRVRYLFAGTFLIILAVSFPTRGARQEQGAQQKDQQAQSQETQQAAAPTADAAPKADVAAPSQGGGQAAQAQASGNISGTIVDG